MSGRVGRNDSWLCGSGKKYKRCCLGAGANGPHLELVSSNGGPSGGGLAARVHDLDRGVLERILDFGMSEFEDWAPDGFIPMDVDAPTASMLRFDCGTLLLTDLGPGEQDRVDLRARWMSGSSTRSLLADALTAPAAGWSRASGSSRRR